MAQSSSCHAEVSDVPQHPGTSCHTVMGPSMGRAAPPGPGDPRCACAHLKAVSSTFPWSLLTSSGMRARWDTCVAAQPNWKMMMKGR